ncbi:NEAT domain-containing protein [Alkalicoccobacillus murimartini]|uniref:Heme-binding NEAT domain protein n=1 Tax=Alkalicoccobacillus murimartini TaxID=171685 RepID=A0ABT9YJ87_9BACI|nr:NEAT domain-containing protein [Alkalicoccobacillus murimartini]MDQ0207744.1 heme-binding NEAT domain protein [Alkalicoccobacillus murimartini]
MKAKYKSLVNGFLAFLLVLATFLPSFSNVAYAENQELKNGTYEVSFAVHKDGTNEVSVMDDYTKKPAVLTVQDGSFSIDMTLTNSNWYEDFTIEGSRPEVVEENPNNNERIVRFPISNLEEKVDAWVHIIVTGIPGFNYDHEYDVQIAFDQSTLEPIQVEEEPESEEPGTEEPGTEEPGTEEPGTEEPGTEEPGTEEPGTEEPGTEEPGTEEPGTEEPGTEEPGTEEPGTEEPVTEEPGAEEPGTEEPGTEEPGTEEPGAEEPVTLEDGTYHIPFTTKHSTEDRDSTMSRYLVSPTTAVVKDGKATVKLTTKDSDVITGLQLESNGEFKEGNITEEDAETKIRTYEFQLSELTKEVQAKVSMRVPMGNGQVYENTQSFRVVLALDEAEKQPEAEEPGTDEEEEQPYELKDGNYNILFESKHATEDRPSSMGDYLTNPTSLVVEDGVSTLTLTTKDSHVITDIQLQADGEYTSGSVVDEDEQNQTRSYAYIFNELISEVPAKVSMRVPLGNGQYYENVREFRLFFDLEGAELEESEEPAPPIEEPTPEEPGTEQPTPEEPGTDDEEPVNGQYEADFTVFKNGTNEASVMDDYTEKPATIFIKDGEYTVDLTLTNSNWYQGLTINGEEPATVSEDAEANKRVIQFEMDGLEEKVDAWVHIVVTGIPGFDYDNEYDVQIAFDATSLKLIEEDVDPTPLPENPGTEQPTPEEPGTEEPTPEEPGTEEPENEKPTPENPGTEQPTPENPGTDEEELVNGQYEADFTVFKNGTNEASVMDDYTEKPATIYVKDGKFSVDLTLTHNDWYKELTIDGKKPAVVSEDKDHNKKTVRYETDSLSTLVDAWVHIVVTGVPGFEYDNQYDVQIALDVDSLELVKKDEQPPTPVTPSQPGDVKKPNNNEGPKDQNKDNDLDELVDGRYEVDFSVLKDGTSEISVMDQYTEKPATVFVKDGQFTVDLTLTNSDWYQDLKIQNQRPEVISEDEAAGKRVVRFDTDDLSKKVDAWVHIIVSPIQYDNQYDVQIALNVDSLKLIEKDQEPPLPIKAGTPINLTNGPGNNQTDPLSYDRGDKDTVKPNSNQVALSGKEVNAKTSENSIVWLYVSLFLLSIGYFTWKYLRKRTVQ